MFLEKAVLLSENVASIGVDDRLDESSLALLLLTLFGSAADETRVGSWPILTPPGPTGTILAPKSLPRPSRILVVLSCQTHSIILPSARLAYIRQS